LQFASLELKQPNQFMSKFSVFTSAFLTSLLLQAADPEPRVVAPGQQGTPPSDAVVLFDGKNLSKWQSVNGGEAKWKLVDGPAEVKGEGQGRGNSGVYLQGRYEIQVLDSYENKTYPNGQAGAFYGFNPPLVNASRKPGEWQTYDIIFRAPKKGADGQMREGSFTVLHNGVLIQDHIPVKGTATTAAEFQGDSPTGPLILQDHGNPVRFRNIWIRKLEPKKE
jgi:hypothetical protein